MDIAKYHDLLGIPAELLGDDEAITDFLALRIQSERWESLQQHHALQESQDAL